MVVVVGMARSGLAVSRLLAGRGIAVFATDSGVPELTGEFDRAGIRHETGRHSERLLDGAEEVVVSPGVPGTIPFLTRARELGVPVVGEIEVASRYLAGDIVAITGSNGKTTTTSLVGHVLGAIGRKVQIGGNIGTPMSELVPTSTGETVNVIEVSSFQLDGIRDFRPRVGVLLNVTPDHLERYDDFEGYRRSKHRLFENQQSRDVAVVNRDDPGTYPLPAGIRSRVREFSLRGASGDPAAATLRDGILRVGGRTVMARERVPLRGDHNVENVLAALLAVEVYDPDWEAVAAAVESFRPVEHRLEPAGTIGGVAFVNDSKATNVDSAVKAVGSFAGNIVVILGGKGKGASYAPLVDAMRGRVRHVVTLGAAAAEIERAVGDAFPVRRVASMAEAVDAALELARSGDVVLLSPACASYDMYRNYEERGRDFKSEVGRRAGGHRE